VWKKGVKLLGGNDNERKGDIKISAESIICGVSEAPILQNIFMNLSRTVRTLKIRGVSPTKVMK